MPDIPFAKKLRNYLRDVTNICLLYYISITQTGKCYSHLLRKRISLWNQT